MLSSSYKSSWDLAWSFSSNSWRLIEEILSADKLIYQSISALENSILSDSSVKHLDMSCFNGNYVTGKVTDDYLQWVESKYSS